MIEAYSNNVTVAENALVPFSTAFVKGNTVEMSGDSAIKFKKCGIYTLSLNANVIANAGGLVSLQLVLNGVKQVNAVAAVTAADTTSTHNISFSTKIQVPSDSTNCACSPDFTVNVINNGVSVTCSLVDVLVTKIV